MFQAGNGLLILSYGQKCMALNLGLHWMYTHMFIVAEMNYSIMGRNLLQIFGLVVDLPGWYLTDPETSIKACSMVKFDTSLCLSVAHANQDDAIFKLLKEYQSISVLFFHKEVLTHSVIHYIETNGPPICYRPWWLVPEMLKATKIELQQMIIYIHPSKK